MCIVLSSVPNVSDCVVSLWRGRGSWPKVELLDATLMAIDDECIHTLPISTSTAQVPEIEVYTKQCQLLVAVRSSAMRLYLSLTATPPSTGSSQESVTFDTSLRLCA